VLSVRAEGADGTFEAERLVSADWVAQERIVVGSEIPFVVSEIDAPGLVTVTGIGACPEIEPDDRAGRRLVTAVFRSVSKNIVDVRVEGATGPLGCTATHPFWSVDRRDFVQAGELLTGERLLAESGEAVRVVAITPRRRPPMVVYNLEVDAEHVYRVGKDGVLVHNTCPSDSLGRNLSKAGYGSRPRGYDAAHIVPTGAFSGRSDDVQKALGRVQRKFDTYLGAGARDSAINGFWGLSRGTTTLRKHAGTHTDDYFFALDQEFRTVTNKAGAEAAMARIWKRIENGEFANK
jgi:hypothetical protein